MPHNKDEIEFLPDIYKLINSQAPSASLVYEEEFIQSIANKYNLPLETAEIIINSFFEELRSAILDNKMFIAKNWGSMHISSPISDGNKQRVFPKFKPYPNLRKLLNEK